MFPQYFFLNKKDFDWLKTRCNVKAVIHRRFHLDNKPHLLKNRKLIELKKKHVWTGSWRISGWDKTYCYILMTTPNAIINSRIARLSLDRIFSFFWGISQVKFLVCVWERGGGRERGGEREGGWIEGGERDT